MLNKGFFFILAVLAFVFCFLLKPVMADVPISMLQNLDPISKKGHDFHWHGRIFAMGDIHSDARNALAMLHKAGLIDRKGNWSGGNTMLVQLGDIVDRGPDTRLLYAFFRRLRLQASASGGKVINILGNHEPMQLCGTLQYVHPQDFESYGSPGARFFSFTTKGEDGQDLRSWDTALMVNRTLFVHAGIAPEFASMGLETLNNRMREAISDCSDDFANGERSPIWNRVYSMSPEPIACRDLVKTLDTLGADRMIVGHTIQDGGVHLRCAGRLILADTGASRFINNNPTLVEFVNIGDDSTKKGGDGEGQGPAGDMWELALDISDFARGVGTENGADPMEGLRLSKRKLEPSVNAAPWAAWKEAVEMEEKIEVK